MSPIQTGLIVLVFSVLLVMNSQPLQAREFEPTWESLDSRPMPEWFLDAKFGIFIHWGVYSVPAWRQVTAGRYASYAEWYYARVMFNEKNGGKEFHARNYGSDFEYRDFGPLFKAELFEPEFWAELFERAGARYVVLTSKHHDGYCLWPAKSPFKKGWNSADTGPGRDLVGDLTRAVRARGLRMGLYYSIIEWESNRTHRTESGYFIPERLVEKHAIPEEKYVDEHMIPQLKELVTAYQPAVIFADAGEWDRTAAQWKTIDFLAWLYNNAPNRNEVVVNDRFGSDMPGKHGDYFSSEYEDSDATGLSHPWEESRGGNLLLNVGPTADGRIPVIMQQRLVDIGRWLAVNGKGIYGTRPWKETGREQASGRSVRFTRKNRDLYLICTEWPERPLAIGNLSPGEGTTVRLLGFDGPISWIAAAKGTVLINLPQVTPATLPCDHAWVFEISSVLGAG